MVKFDTLKPKLVAKRCQNSERSCRVWSFIWSVTHVKNMHQCSSYASTCVPVLVCKCWLWMHICSTVLRHGASGRKWDSARLPFWLAERDQVPSTESFTTTSGVWAFSLRVPFFFLFLAFFLFASPLFSPFLSVLPLGAGQWRALESQWNFLFPRNLDKARPF